MTRSIRSDRGDQVAPAHLAFQEHLVVLSGRRDHYSHRLVYRAHLRAGGRTDGETGQRSEIRYLEICQGHLTHYDDLSYAHWIRCWLCSYLGALVVQVYL